MKFEAKMKRVKVLEKFWMYSEIREWSEKRIFLLHITVFDRAKNWSVKKCSISKLNFVITFGFWNLFFVNFCYLIQMDFSIFDFWIFDRCLKVSGSHCKLWANFEFFQQFCWVLSQFCDSSDFVFLLQSSETEESPIADQHFNKQLISLLKTLFLANSTTKTG